jgi:hypothetical protein
VPLEQPEGFNRTKQTVARVVRSVLGTTAVADHETLLLSAEPLDLAPVPDLTEAANVLLTVWDALEHVEVRSLQLLRRKVSDHSGRRTVWPASVSWRGVPIYCSPFARRLIRLAER